MKLADRMTLDAAIARIRNSFDTGDGYGAGTIGEQIYLQDLEKVAREYLKIKDDDDGTYYSGFSAKAVVDDLTAIRKAIYSTGQEESQTVQATPVQEQIDRLSGRVDACMDSIADLRKTLENAQQFDACTYMAIKDRLSNLEKLKAAHDVYRQKVRELTGCLAW